MTAAASGPPSSAAFAWRSLATSGSAVNLPSTQYQRYTSRVSSPDRTSSRCTGSCPAPPPKPILPLRQDDPCRSRSVGAPGSPPRRPRAARNRSRRTDRRRDRPIDSAARPRHPDWPRPVAMRPGSRPASTAGRSRGRRRPGWLGTRRPRGAPRAQAARLPAPRRPPSPGSGRAAPWPAPLRARGAIDAEASPLSRARPRAPTRPASRRAVNP